MMSFALVMYFLLILGGVRHVVFALFLCLSVTLRADGTGFKCALIHLYHLMNESTLKPGIISSQNHIHRTQTVCVCAWSESVETVNSQTS